LPKVVDGDEPDEEEEERDESEPSEKRDVVILSA
jgi:hypothetical protein